MNKLSILGAFAGCVLFTACTDNAKTAQGSSEPSEAQDNAATADNSGEYEATDELARGRELMATTFAAADADKDGAVSRAEIVSYGESVFAAMDVDSSESVDATEFDELDFGLDRTSSADGLTLQYEAAKRIVFALRDRNGDGVITAGEQAKSMDLDFDRADLDEDGTLTEDEFLSGYGPSVVFKAVLKT